MNPIHQDDYNAIGNQHEQVTGRINDMLIELQNHSYATGVERGKALAKQAVIEAGTISPTLCQTIHLGQPGVTVEPCLMLGPADDEVACLLFTAAGTEVRLTWPTQTQALAVLAAATGEQAETPPAHAPVEQATHKKSLSVRQSIIDVLLSTTGQSEAVAADAIMSIMRPPVERVEQDHDAIALDKARKIIQIMYGDMPKGGSTQLLAMIQVCVLEAMSRALTPQPAPTAAPSRDVIRATLMAHGFTIKEGQSDLKPYVYEAVEALFAKAAPTAAQDVAGLIEALEKIKRIAEHPPVDRAIRQVAIAARAADKARIAELENSAASALAVAEGGTQSHNMQVIGRILREALAQQGKEQTP